jgi:hypothetical protein
VLGVTENDPNLTVSILDEDGSPVAALTPDDFSITYIDDSDYDTPNYTFSLKPTAWQIIDDIKPHNVDAEEIFFNLNIEYKVDGFTTPDGESHDINVSRNVLAVYQDNAEEPEQVEPDELVSAKINSIDYIDDNIFNEIDDNLLSTQPTEAFRFDIELEYREGGSQNIYTERVEGLTADNPNLKVILLDQNQVPVTIFDSSDFIIEDNGNDIEKNTLKITQSGWQKIDDINTQSTGEDINFSIQIAYDANEVDSTDPSYNFFLNAFNFVNAVYQDNIEVVQEVNEIEAEDLNTGGWIRENIFNEGQYSPQGQNDIVSFSIIDSDVSIDSNNFDTDLFSASINLTAVFDNTQSFDINLESEHYELEFDGEQINLKITQQGWEYLDSFTSDDLQRYSGDVTINYNEITAEVEDSFIFVDNIDSSSNDNLGGKGGRGNGNENWKSFNFESLNSDNDFAIAENFVSKSKLEVSKFDINDRSNFSDNIENDYDFTSDLDL